MEYHHNIYEERRCQICCPWSADLDTLVCPLWPQMSTHLALGIWKLQHTWGQSSRLSREGRRFKKHLLQFMHACLSNAPTQTNRKLVYIQKRAFWSEEEDGTDYWPALSISYFPQKYTHDWDHQHLHLNAGIPHFSGMLHWLSCCQLLPMDAPVLVQ
jgi:hypothetical protein